MTRSQDLVEDDLAPKGERLEVLYLSDGRKALPSQGALRQLAGNLLCPDGWTSLLPPKRPRLTAAGQSFVYAPSCPSLPPSRPHRHRSIPEWDDFSDLPLAPAPPFASSDFLATLHAPPDLWALVPRPHLLPSPHHLPPLPPACPAGFATDVGNGSPYARSALFIPISGQPRFAGSSAATIVPGSAPPRRVGPDAEGEGDTGAQLVLWTQKSVLRLWHFLRKIQEKGNCGPIGISYEPSYLAARRGADAEPQKKRQKLSRLGPHQPARDWAYVKVYCPTVLADYLLNALRNLPAGKDEGRRQPLLRARIARVDHDGSVSVG